MKKSLVSKLILLSTASFLLTGCVLYYGNTFDIDTYGIPRFVRNDFTQLGKITKISRFRSAAGHDYSDDFESCRNMKHYYAPYDKYRVNNEIEIYSPVDGVIHSIIKEGHGASKGLINQQVRIQSSEYPAFVFVLFHIDLISLDISKGKKLQAGELIGHARMYYPDINDYGGSFDIAVWVNTPSGIRNISYFDTMADTLFSNYIARGAKSRDDFIISKEARDADPLTCDGQRFTSNGKLENWFTLNMTLLH